MISSHVGMLRGALFSAMGLLPLTSCGGEAAGAGTGGAGTGGAGTGGTGTGGEARACDDPVPIATDPTESVVTCQGGWHRRLRSVECPSKLPRSEAIPPSQWPANDSCKADADCTPSAYCQAGGEVSANYCVAGCARDADCDEGYVCECGEVSGHCVKSSCTGDADCGPGLLCASYTDLPGCDIEAFACQSWQDQCAEDSECPMPQRCTLAPQGFRRCVQPNCVEGRPFLVDGEARLAALQPRSDFLAEQPSPELRGLSSAARTRLGDAWARIALMEHASVAAFARFTLELLAFGAPAELVASAAAAMADEVTHARGAFALASGYQGQAVGPGPLAMDGCLAESDLESCVFTAFLEGCIGETVAALEAREALALASEPTVRALLARVADDEARHAQLAWRFMQWALPRCSRELPLRLSRALKAELDAPPALVPTAEPLHAALRAHGVLMDSESRALRCSALRGVVAPCLRALLAAQRDEVGFDELGLDGRSNGEGGSCSRSRRARSTSRSTI